MHALLLSVLGIDSFSMARAYVIDFWSVLSFSSLLAHCSVFCCSRSAGTRWSLRKPEFPRGVNLGAQVLGTALNSLRFQFCFCLFLSTGLNQTENRATCLALTAGMSYSNCFFFFFDSPQNLNARKAEILVGLNNLRSAATSVAKKFEEIKGSIGVAGVTVTPSKLIGSGL